VSISVVDGNTCPEGLDPVFYKEWKGTEKGCFIADGLSCGKNCRYKKGTGLVVPYDSRRSGCVDWMVIDPIEPIKQTEIHGKTICGKRGGIPFESVVRPELETGHCPNGTTPCSEMTSIENTVCYPLEDHEAFCPIT
jgi:hypothetical protein